MTSRSHEPGLPRAIVALLTFGFADREWRRECRCRRTAGSVMGVRATIGSAATTTDQRLAQLVDEVRLLRAAIEPHARPAQRSVAKIAIVSRDCSR